MKFLKKIILIISLILINFNFSFAQNAPCYEMASYQGGGQSAPRTPLFNIQIFDQPCFPLGQPDNYKQGVQFMFDLMIGVCIALAVLLFTFGAAEGIISRETSGNGADKVYRSKDRMQNAIVGLLIVLGSWLVINTINPDLIRLPVLQSVQGLQSLPTKSTGGTPGTGVKATTPAAPVDPNAINPGTGLQNDAIVAP